jgi:Platelet-activating factor acetylhydrolase, isoform II
VTLHLHGAHSVTISFAVLVCTLLRPYEPGRVELPAPTGPSAVGTTRWVVTDTSRRDPFEGREAREVEVVAWYPASRGAGQSTAPYLRGRLETVRAFASRLGKADLLDDLAAVRTHAFIDAMPASTAAKLPLLIFSHGYTGIPEASTSLLEDLASHGYAVLSVIHPYEATAATLTDGRVVSMLDAAGKLRAPIHQVFAEWTSEDETMTAVTSSSDRGEQERILRKYLGTLHHTREALERWVDDR